eukprot:scaffold156937_cov50-Prasinocladus_malaysianus.AAC.2
MALLELGRFTQHHYQASMMSGPRETSSPASQESNQKPDAIHTKLKSVWLTDCPGHQLCRLGLHGDPQQLHNGLDEQGGPPGHVSVTIARLPLGDKHPEGVSKGRGGLQAVVHTWRTCVYYRCINKIGTEIPQQFFSQYKFKN